MIETYFSAGSLTTANAFLVSLIIGVSFGWCLEQAGFGSSRRLAGIFYFRDMAVLKVMFSAVVTAMLGLGFAVAFGAISLDAIYIPETILGAQIIGGFIFGIGYKWLVPGYGSSWCGKRQDRCSGVPAGRHVGQLRVQLVFSVYRTLV